MTDYVSTESRILVLQGEAINLRKQVEELKGLLESELDRLRCDIQTQLAEVRRFFLNHEQESMFQVDSLEKRVDNITIMCQRAMLEDEFEDKLSIPSSGLLEGLREPPSAAQSCIAYESEQHQETASSLEQLGGMHGTIVNGTLPLSKSLLSRIDAVHELYASQSSNMGTFHSSLGLTGFTALVRNAGICYRYHTSPELLWMSVLRELSTSSVSGTRHKTERRIGSTLLTLKQFNESSETSKQVFAFQRQQCITRQCFPLALYYLFVVLSRLPYPLAGSSHEKGSTDMAKAPLAAFTAFLTDSFLPAVEQSVHQRCPSGPSPFLSQYTDVTQLTQSTLMDTEDETNAVCKALSKTVSIYQESTDVQMITQKFRRQLTNCFSRGLESQRNSARHYTCITMERFYELLRRHDILPLISRLQIKQIFNCCAGLQKHDKAHTAENVPPNTLSMKYFITALFCVAEQLYGTVPAVCDFYPTPQRRIRKLFMKMFTL